MRRVGQLAIASGIVGILATVVLIAFYILEAPQALAAGARTSRLGAINDAMGGVQLMLLVPGAQMVRFTEERRSRFLAIAGMAGLLGTTIVSELYAFGAMKAGDYFPAVATGFGLIGIWIGAISLTGGRLGRLPPGLSRLGIAVGAGLLAIPAGAFLLGGLAMMAAPKLVLNNYPAIAFFLIGTLATVIGLPIWSIWLGRYLLLGESAVTRGDSYP
ncbi:MAG: hypothetical protein M3077_03770 [Candidatus Dormibacteraeota bacterium]|nr:hypothetical protein [Candidatus Dormibacteraeota bacterium]